MSNATVSSSPPQSSPSKKSKIAENGCLKNGHHGNSAFNGGLVSKRAIEVLNNPSVTTKYNQRVNSDLFHPEHNPQGFVDFGMAENKLMEDVLTEKLEKLPGDSHDVDLRYYPDMRGLPTFRESTATFIQREFKSIHNIEADHIAVAAGVTVLLDSMAFALGDSGDYFMTTSPYYYRIKNDINERAGLNVLEVPPGPDGAAPYALDVKCLEAAYLKAKDEGKRVKAFVLVNPNNPLGSVYSAQQVSDVLDFCAKYQLHVILDEIYGMSVFEEGAKFTSALALPHPDPQRTHFIWGFSKDFGLSGYRCGIVWTPNKEVISFLTSLGVFHLTAPLVQMRLKNMMEDTEWFHQTYRPALQTRLRESYTSARDVLEECGAWVNPSRGGIFIWFDASKFMPEKSKDGEMWLLEKFMAEKVFLLPGHLCHSQAPGYFRLVFALNQTMLKEGLRRIKQVLQSVKSDAGSH